MFGGEGGLEAARERHGKPVKVLTRETTKSLRPCVVDWLKANQFVHHPLISSSDRGKAIYIHSQV